MDDSVIQLECQLGERDIAFDEMEGNNCLNGNRIIREVIVQPIP